MDAYLQAAIEEAKKGLAEGGVPIGSVLVIDGKIVGGATTGVCRRVVPYCMPKWTAWKTPDA